MSAHAKLHRLMQAPRQRKYPQPEQAAKAAHHRTPLLFRRLRLLSLHGQTTHLKQLRKLNLNGAALQAWLTIPARAATVTQNMACYISVANPKNFYSFPMAGCLHRQLLQACATQPLQALTC